ncbi:Ger(x)C family spore germination protein [Ferdinandcohnia sp. Marseille-Q9671]
MRKLLLVALFLIATLTGCVGQVIVEDVNLITGLGYDLEEDQIKVTHLFPIFKPDRQSENDVYEVQGKLEEDLIKLVNNQSRKPVVFGTLEVVVLQDKLAERGILHLIDQVRRHPVIGSRVYLAVAAESANELLKVKEAPVEAGGVISDLIEHNIKIGMLPKTNLHIFRSVNMEEGMDPILPLLEKKGGRISIKGIALFDGDKYMGAIEDLGDAFVFKLLMGNSELRDSLTLHLENTDKFIRIERPNSERSFRVTDALSAPKINIEIKMDTYVTEFSGDTITKQLKKNIENEVAEDIEDRAAKLIKQFQEQHIDPIGIGFEVKSRTRGWDLKKWNDLYENADIQVRADVNVMHYGVFE